jgi:ribosomal protein S6
VIDYEILLLFDVELPDERQNEIVTRTRELVERGGGTFERHDVWGRRRLAYEIDHKAEGSYHLLTFQADPGRDLARTQDHRRRAAAHGRQAAEARPDSVGAAAERRPRAGVR